MACINEEIIISDSSEDIKYPIHIGPVFPCILCNSNFISLFFLHKHFEKCNSMNIMAFSKIKIDSKIRKGKSLGLAKNTKGKLLKSNQTLNKPQLINEKKPQLFEVVTSDILQIQNNVQSINPDGVRNGFSCDLCNKRFARLDNLKLHWRIHTGEKPYQCEICEKQFSRLDKLKLHLRIHTGEKPYTCDICQKQFSRLDKLKLHWQIHANQNLSFQCHECQKVFYNISHFNTHLRIHHTGEKIHQCNKCKKTFSQLSQLKSHLPTHIGEKPYHCYVCNKQFSRSDKLRSHIYTHTGEKPFQCEICKRPFNRRDNLKYHMRTHKVI